MENVDLFNCPVCGSKDAGLFMQTRNTHGAGTVSRESFNLVKCRSCGLIYLNPRPLESKQGQYYNINYYRNNISGFNSIIEHWWTVYVNSRRKRMVKKYKQKGKILDLGCGAGDFLDVFKSDSFDLYGVEPNLQGYSLSSKKIKGRIFKDGLINCGFTKDYFDAVTLWHVFEHLDNPKQELNEIKRILAADGLLFISVPNANSIGFKMSGGQWFHMDSPRHLYNYTPATLGNLLNKSGFRVVKMVFPSFEYPLDFYHSMLNKLGENGIIRVLLMLPIFILSFIIKYVSSWFRASETMMIISAKES